MKADVKKRRKIKPGDMVFQIVNYLVFLIITLICVYPFYYMIVNTINPKNAEASTVQAVPSTVLPRETKAAVDSPSSMSTCL